MDQGKLLCAVAGLLNNRSLQCVEDHAKSGGAGSALGVPLVGLPIYMLLQNYIRSLCQRGFHIFGNSDDRNTLGLTDVHDRQQLLGLTAAGSKDHHIPLLQESGSAMDSLRRRNKAGRPLDAAHQMCHMLADYAGVAAACGTDPGGVAQKLHSLGKLIIIKLILHFRNALGLNIVGSPGSGDCFFGNHIQHSFSYKLGAQLVIIEDSTFLRIFQFAFYTIFFF